MQCCARIGNERNLRRRIDTHVRAREKVALLERFQSTLKSDSIHGKRYASPAEVQSRWRCSVAVTTRFMRTSLQACAGGDMEMPGDSTVPGVVGEQLATVPQLTVWR